VLERRLRFWTSFLIAGLAVSGATAMPLNWEMALGKRLLGNDLAWHGRLPQAVSAWLVTLDRALQSTAVDSPFLFYGLDWLAFGHFAIAGAFVGALRDPVRNRWLYAFGVVTAALVVPWALVLGQLRGIPFWWRCIDSAFGVGALVPAWLCHRWSGELEATGSEGDRRA
jgi:hypothetical protein